MKRLFTSFYAFLWLVILVTGTAAAQPTAPGNLSPNGVNGVLLTPTFNWTASTGASGITYRLQIYTNSGFSGSSLFSASGISTNSFTLPPNNLAYSTVYYWRVRAESGAGNSSYATGSFTTANQVTAPVLISPSAVTSVSITPTLNWQASTGSGPVTYDVYLNSDPTFTDISRQRIGSLGLSGTSLTVPNLPGNVLSYDSVYYWRVIAHDANGLNTSLTASFRTKLLSPSLLSPSNGILGQPTGLTLSWSSINGATSYHLQVNTASNFSGTNVFNSYSVSTNSQAISGLNNNTVYYWRVSAKNSTTNDSSDFSNVFNFTTVLAAPTGLTPNGVVVSTSPLLSWNPVAGTGVVYDIFVSTDSTFTDSNRWRVANLSYAATSIQLPLANDAGHILSNDSLYYWRVRAKDANNVFSAYSGAKFTTKPAGPTLLSPANNSVAQPTNLVLTWSSIAGAVSYHLQANTASDFSGTDIFNSFSVTANSQSISGLSNNTVYYWRVNAKISSTDSTDFSSTFNFRTVIAPPTLLIPDGTTNESLTPTLIWTAPSGVAPIKYVLQLSPDQTFLNTGLYQAWQVDYTGTSYTVVPGRLLNNTRYYWRVKAQDANGESAFAIASFLTKLKTPELPQPDSGAVGQPTTLTLSWSPVNGAASYHLQVNTQADFQGQTIFDSYSVLTNSQLLTNLTRRVVYYWRVRAVNNSIQDSSDFSNTFSFATTTAQIPIPSNPIGGQVVYSPDQQLSWYLNNSNGFTFTYDLQYSTDPNMLLGVQEVDGISSTNYTIQLSSGNTIYYWRVRSREINSGFYSAYSNTESFKTDASLGAVSPILSWPIGGATIYTALPTLSWYLNTGLVPGVVTYDVEIVLGTDPFTGNPTSGLSGLTTSSVTLTTPLLANTVYKWRVRSHNGANVSGWSYTGTFKVDLSQGGAPVPILSWPVGGTTVYNATPTLSWYLSTAATGPIYYDVDIVPLNTSFGSNPAFTQIFGNSLNLTNALIGGTTYQWRVRTHNGTNVSGWSSVSTFIVATGYNGAPVPILSWPIGNASVYTTTPRLTWYLGVGTSGTLSYDIEIVPASNAFTGTPTYSGIAATDFDIVNPLNSPTNYKWRVRSNNGASTSAWSLAETFNVLPAAVGAPVPIAAWPLGGATVYTNNPLLTWYLPSAPAGFVTYEVEIKPFYQSFDGTNTVAGIPSNSYSVSSTLVSGTSYHWRVRLISSTAGTSAWSDENIFGGAYFNTAASALSSIAPAIGSPKDGVSVSGGKPVLSWMISTAPASNQTYKVEISKSADMSSPVLVKENLTNQFLEISTLSSGTYYWRVQSKNDGNSYSNYSPVGKFSIDAVTGIDDNKNKNIIPSAFELSQNYPNPFNPSTIIRFALPKSSFVTLKIYNILGQEVKTLVNENRNAGTYSVQWNGDDNFGIQAASGAYIYRIISGENVVTKKMILLR